MNDFVSANYLHGRQQWFKVMPSILLLTDGTHMLMKPRIRTNSSRPKKCQSLHGSSYLVVELYQDGPRNLPSGLAILPTRLRVVN